MDSKQQYKVIGLMSGTSLDGVDVACCSFRIDQNRWKYKIEDALAVKYSASWIKKLNNAPSLTSEALLSLHEEYGRYLGELCDKFIQLKAVKKVDFISSHGHTVFHQPANGFTFQLGNGYALHAESKLPVIFDFRSMDVALDGEGAPLVPIGDRLLFSDYDVCLNLGGIANLSTDVKGTQHAFDICYANLGLNYLASKDGKLFDKKGEMASNGKVNVAMLTALLRANQKFRKKRPSLSRELFEAHIKPILNNEKISLEDRLCTFTESIAKEISTAIQELKPKSTVLCTGGGAFNSFLIYTLMEKCGDSISLVIPDDDLVKFKEALVFAFLGVLRSRNETNCLKSVTGASRDHSAGMMVGFK
jgi:anhydro-N-acetylmuramic acid kinase